MVKVPKYFYAPDNDSFGVDDHKRLCWYSCREDFADDFPKVKRFFFCEETDRLKKVTSFINKVQKVLKLKKKDRLAIKKTDKKEIICIKLSNFWKDEVRRSLLTILLRAGCYYNPRKGNWRETFKKSRYLSGNALKAAFRFMKGNTRINIKNSDWFEGWKDYFIYYSGSELRKRLAK